MRHTASFKKRITRVKLECGHVQASDGRQPKPECLRCKRAFFDACPPRLQLLYQQSGEFIDIGEHPPPPEPPPIGDEYAPAPEPVRSCPECGGIGESAQTTLFEPATCGACEGDGVVAA